MKLATSSEVHGGATATTEHHYRVDVGHVLIIIIDFQSQVIGVLSNDLMEIPVYKNLVPMGELVFSHLLQTAAGVFNRQCQVIIYVGFCYILS